MKKLIKFFLITVVLIFALLLTAPFLFKGKIISLIQTEANKNLNAELFFEDVDISLLRHFPNLSVEIQNLRISGVDTFEGTNLFAFETLQLVVDIKTVLSDRPIGIRKIHLKNTTASLITLADGTSNSDILKPSDASDVATSSDGEATSFALELNSYTLENFHLNYSDFQGNVFAKLSNLHHAGKGDFTQDIVALATTTSIDTLDVIMDGIHLLNNVNAASEFALTYNGLEESIAFGENNLRINELKLTFNGGLKFLEDALDLDIKFAVPSNDFKSVISLIPAYYYQDFNALVAEGLFDFSGFIKGKYFYENEAHTPSFGMQLSADKGLIDYPDLPEKIENIQIDASVNHPGGDLDLMRVSIPKFNMTLAKNPIAGNFAVSTPFSDPNVNMALATKLDFQSLEKVLKAEGYTIKGLLDADFAFKGRLSQLENANYDNVVAKGGGTLTDFTFSSANLALPVGISKAEANLSPQLLTLPQFDMNIGKSDFSAKGQLDNLMHFLLLDTTLVGRFVFNSNLIDANELLSLMDTTAPQGETPDTTPTGEGAPKVPANIDFLLDATIANLLFDHYEITDVKGQLEVANQAVAMKQLRMNTLGGAIEMNGSYDTKQATAPLADFSFDLVNVALEQVFDKVTTIKALVPLGAAAKGSLTTKFQFQSVLDNELTPVLSSIDAAGMFRTANIQYASSTLDKIASSLQNDRYKELRFKNALVDFQVADGRISVSPFSISLGGQNAEFSGSHGIDQSMDYKIAGKFPAAQLVNSAISLPAAGANKNVNLNILIGGTVFQPKISFEVASMVDALRDQVNDIVKDEISKAVDNAKDAAQAQAAKLITEATAKGDQLIAAAQGQAEKLRMEAKNAGDKLIREAKDAASKLEQEAGSNPIKQAAAKRAGDALVKKAENQAAALENEAIKSGNRLVKEATDQKEKLIDEAKAKAALEN